MKYRLRVSSASRYRFALHVIALLLAYALIISLFAPLNIKRAQASAETDRGAKENAPLGGANRKLTPNSSTQGAGKRPGELLVRFRGGVSEQDKGAAVAAHGGRRKEKLRGESGIEKLEVVAEQDTGTVALQLRLNPAIEFVEPNFLIQRDDLRLDASATAIARPFTDLNSGLNRPSALDTLNRTGAGSYFGEPTAKAESYTNSLTPNSLLQAPGTSPDDPRFNEQWALSNTGQNSGQFGSDIGVTAAWRTTTGSQSMVVAVIDSGIDFTHPDLATNRWTNPTPGPSGDVNGWDYITDTGAIIDEQGHGTAIAGLIAAQGNNATGISGVMWRGSLMSLRVLDNTGTGDIASAVEAIDYAVAHGAQVINISWGTTGESLALKEAIERALRRDVVVVCSAGNNGQDLEQTPYYPASFNIKDLISVAATDNFDQLVSWSNWGRRRVTIAAPGVNLLTTHLNGNYWLATGTSASAPLVSGVAGLIKSARPGLDARRVAKAISDGARQVASLSGKVSSSGVVSASGALNELRWSPNPHPFPTSGYGSGGTGLGGTFNTTPPPQTTGGSGPNLPNLDNLRNTETESPGARQPIQGNPANVCADCDPQSGGGGGGYYPPNDPNFSTQREQPRNETGEPGVDLGSRNFNWSLPLVGLAGRAGLDLNLSIYYNSLLWTKDGSYVKYNADLGSPAPGFRLGLPTLQQRFYNSQTGIWAYIMVTSSGGRVEMRQVGASSIYESQDGSYTQLDVSTPAAPVVRTSDGTQLKFTPVTNNNEFRCVQIKDRNGNYISASYDTNNGHLQTIVDTLGRSVSFVYDGNNNLQAIRQTWAGVAHDWATFSYGQVWVAPNFGGGLLVNGPNNNYVTVLTQVSVHDGSFYTFEYNAAFGQVKKISHYAPDTSLLSYTSYNMDAGVGQTDCPRFTERRDYALYGVMDVSQEVVTTFSVAGDGSWSQQTAPDGTIHKEFFYTGGWSSGLTYLTETWSNSVKRKWTTISWTQDDTNLSYQMNPRPTETNTYDAEGNRRRTTIEYNQGYSLPTHVREYGGTDGQIFLRLTAVSYYMNAVYIDRRIIGLPYEKLVYDGPTGQIMSRTIFHYDWDAPYFSTQAPSTNYDSVNYPSSFILGRGNLVAVRRYNCDNGTTAYDENQAVWTQLNGYNMAGASIWSEDASSHHTTISYADSFSDGNNSRNTLAYSTTVTDAGNFSSTMQYDYDFGAVTSTQDPQGALQTMTYDAAARITRVTNAVNNAYTRWVYPASLSYVQQFSTIQNGAGEAYSVDFVTGWGKVRASSTDHPGSVGGYSAQFFQYNSMGYLVSQTNPTEINGSWVPTGDDAGWVGTQQTYDWKGRPLLTTNPDGSTRENIYGGCGCAGGEVTTVRDERGRRRRMTMDVLGRPNQAEELNWNQSVYATSNYTYNTRDQITNINQAGLQRTFVYDGHGRLQARTTPEQGTTTYSYNQDDTINVVTDARGATATYGYNNRHLVTGITYSVPGGVAATPNVSFDYDAAGNRTSMTDGVGSATYAYNTLSQMTSETRTFNGVGSYTLSYPSYNLGGQLTNITNFAGAQVGYNYDKTGRPTGVTGAGYAGVTSYINSIAYRAFAAKQMSYGNGRALSLQYDNRMRMTRWDVPGVMGWNYAYNYFGENSGRVTYAQNLYDATLDRSYDYDHVGRMAVAYSGADARAHVGIPGSPWGIQDGPYASPNWYDVWGNITSRQGWGGENPWFSASYTNNKRTGFTYDAAGNLLNDGGQSFTYNGTGQQATASYSGYALQQSYDGNGLRVKKNDNGTQTYYLRSSVLGGQVVAEITWTGTIWQWSRGYVYLGSQLLAVQQQGSVSWMHEDPVNKSKRVTDSSGTVVSTVELDPWGADTNRSNNGAFQPRKFTSYERDGNGSDEAMFRRYNRTHSRFDQPDPYDGSYDLSNPQSFNRYAYVQNDPVNFVDPSGLNDVPGPIIPPTVIIPISFDLPIGFSGGGRSGGVNRLRPFPLDPPGRGNERPQNPALDIGEAETLLNNPGCEKFLDSLLAELAKFRDPYSKSFRTILNAANNQGAFHNVVRSPEQLKDGLGGTNSIVGDPSLRIEVDVSNIAPAGFAVGYVIFHEVFHASAGSGGMYGHFTIARAAYSVAKAQGLLGKLANTNAPKAPNPASTTAADWGNASLFDNVLQLGCPKP